MSIAVLLPAYNEEKTIEDIVLKCLKYVDKVFVINDGSIDNTSELASRSGAEVLDYNVNHGKGSALRAGFSKAKDYDIIITIDADGQHDPDEIPIIIKPIQDGVADIVNGSRYLKGNDRNTPKYRRLGQIVLDTLTNLSSGIKLTDTQSGFRAFSNKILDVFKFEKDGFGIESEMIIDAANNNIRITEVEISVKYDVDSSTDNPITHGFSVLIKILSDMAKYKIYYLYMVIGIGLISLAVVLYLLLMLFGIFNLFELNIVLVLGVLLVFIGMIMMIFKKGG
ncbi:MAG: glycosyltransferase family 2 protein [Methanobacteriaceae archaeon]|nr:glycosyltransferase family 2 protein [Methanobacteriaceae archaeon]